MSCNHSELHPPLEWPVMIRASVRGIKRNCRSSSGMNSSVNARAHGPLPGLSTNPWCPSAVSGSSTIHTACGMTSRVPGVTSMRAMPLALVYRPPKPGTTYTAGNMRRRKFGSSHPVGSATPARITTSRPAARLRMALFISNHRRFGSVGSSGVGIRTVSANSCGSDWSR